MRPRAATPRADFPTSPADERPPNNWYHFGIHAAGNAADAMLPRRSPDGIPRPSSPEP